MGKVLIIDAFSEINIKLEKNDIATANKMLEIVTDKIMSNKNNNLISEYIDLSTKKENLLFDSILNKKI